MRASPPATKPSFVISKSSVPSPKPQRRPRPRPRLLVADGDTPFARSMSNFFWDFGFECRTTNTVSQAKELLQYWQPESMFVDFLLPETSAMSLFKYMRQRNLNRKMKNVVVMSKQASSEGIEAMLRAGATNLLVKPFSMEDALRAVDSAKADKAFGPKPAPAEAASAVKKSTEIITPASALVVPAVQPAVVPPPPGLKLADLRRSAPPLPFPPVAEISSATMVKEMHLMNLFLKQTRMGTNSHKTLFNLMRMMAMKVSAWRCSSIQFLNPETGLVLASHDDAQVQHLPLQLSLYPEVLEVRKTGEPLIIKDIQRSPILQSAYANIQDLPFNSMAVFPLFQNRDFFGVVSLRLNSAESRLPMEYIERFGQVCSQIISLTLK
ncbi:MAG: response regulator [Bdellovibrionales bacterium]